jgi:hypothetical protein
MKYFTHNQLPVQITGTELVGYLNCSYQELVDRFGKPLSAGFDDCKSDAEWHIKFEDGAVATIYNWKNGRNYLGDEGMYPWEIMDWNIGGLTGEVVERIKELIKEDITGQQTALPLP